jgi:FkbM family methyltransferase
MAAFMSYAQNFEDVMLWRALSSVPDGFCIDVGAGDPDQHTVTRAFYERGWHGINIDPDPVCFAALVRRRDRDINIPVALAEAPGQRRFLVVPVPGLSTLASAVAFRHRARGWNVRRVKVEVGTLAEICRLHAPREIHFLKIDVEGAEAAVLQGADFAAFRPWIVLAEATVPLTQTENHGEWEHILIGADYRFVWFDGLNRFYVTAEKTRRCHQNSACRRTASICSPSPIPRKRRWRQDSRRRRRSCTVCVRMRSASTSAASSVVSAAV